MPAFLNRIKLRTRLMLLFSVLFLVPFVAEHFHIIHIINDDYYQRFADHADNVAQVVASSPLVARALEHPGSVSQAELGDWLDSLTSVTRVRFIVVMNMQSVRLYHPEPDRIGQTFVGGDEGEVLQGKSYVSSARGTLGFSQRAFRPVFAENGVQTGAVSVGVLSDSIEEIVDKITRPVLSLLLVGLAAGLFFSVLLANSIKKILHGLEPAEIATVLEERSAMLGMVKEGILAVDLEGRVTLVNNEAGRILAKAGINESVLGKNLSGVLPGFPPESVARTGKPEYDDEQDINGLIVIANHMPIMIKGAIAGVISTFRDMTEMSELAERITGINRYLDALRAQSHEFMNKLHAIFGMVRGGKINELHEYLEILVGMKAAEHTAIYNGIKDPLIAGFLTSKSSRARELGISLRYDISGVLPPLDSRTASHGLITILGNVIDNAMDAVSDAPKKHLRITFVSSPNSFAISVADSGRGIEEENPAAIFRKGWSTKGEHRGTGLWLVLKTVDALDGTIEVDAAPEGGAEFTIILPMNRMIGDAHAECAHC